jgi:hypothetical protein
MGEDSGKIFGVGEEKAKLVPSLLLASVDPPWPEISLHCALKWKRLSLHAFLRRSITATEKLWRRFPRGFPK